MDIEKAIEWLKAINAVQNQSIHQQSLSERKEALYMAIDALKEVEQYRQIGTVDECKIAREKHTPKSVEFYGDGEDGKMLCPNCKEDLWDLKECGFNNCPYCGQALEWGD